MSEKRPVTKRHFLKTLILALFGSAVAGPARALDLLENLQEPPPGPIELDLLKNPYKQRLIAQTQEF